MAGRQHSRVVKARPKLLYLSSKEFIQESRMPQYEKHFTLDEARQWVPKLKSKFEKIQVLYSEIEKLREDFERVQKLIQMNGHAPKETGFEERATELQEMVKEITEAGIEIKDISRGLVDFPHMRDGEEVFLCWELADDGLNYWHYIEDGYAGRTPLE
jgi:hypothetical protein